MRTTEKSWSEMSAEEKEMERAEKLARSGGEECDECGHEDYWHQFTDFEGKKWCSDCFEEAMEDEKRANGESDRYKAMVEAYGSNDDPVSD
jgi:hypothetical protein